MIFKNAYNPKGYKKSELDKPHLHEKLNLIKESEIIKARNIEEARKKFNENVVLRYGFGGDLNDFDKLGKGGKGSVSEDFYVKKVDNVEFIDEYEEDENSNEDPQQCF